MDQESHRTLAKCLAKREIEKIPAEILKKVEKYCESRYDELETIKVFYNTAQKNLEKLRKDYTKLSSKTRDPEVKIDALQANVTELRHQLERANTEIERLTNQVTQHESETDTYRKERNDIMDERDQLLKSVDQKDASLKRLQLEIKELETKLEVAVSDKCSAIADLAEMVTKEQTLECNEKGLESQNERLNNEIANLTEKLNRNMTELMELRQNINTSGFDQLEIDLKQKTEELRIANATVSQLTETNRLLTNQSEEKTRKLKEQVNESIKLVDHYRKELDAKIKLAELYKDNSDDCQVQSNKLTVAMKELRRILDETTNRCEVLEAKIKDDEAQHLVDLNAKDEIIAQMKEELKSKNDLFEKVKTDRVETILENFAPSAASANRVLKGCLSLTEIYTRYQNAIDSVDRKEDECIQLRMDLEHVRSELNEKIPEFEQQRIEYQKLLTVNEDLNQKVNNFVVEQGRCQEELDEVRSKFGYLERENSKLKTSQTDLSRQICYLLNEIQTSKGGMASGQQESTTVGLTNQVIAKKLVTFSNIEEMQENNRQLLQKVRDLSTKVEELEEIQNHINMQCYEAKISSYEKQLKDAEQSQRANEEMLAMCLQQKERFKELYYDAMKDFCKKPAAESIDGIEGDVTVMSSTIISKNVPKDEKELEIEKTLQDKIKELKDLREEYVDYRKESSANFKLLNDEFEAMQTKVGELISANCQLSTQANFANQQLKTQGTDISIYKKQIQTLEERNQMYDKTIVKHEIAIKHLRDEALNTLKKLTAAENRCEYLQSECRRLIDKNSNLEVENKALRRQKLTHSILQSNLEMMKASSERSQYEGRLQMEQQLEQATRECSALQLKLEEEQNRFREDAATFKRQADSAVKKMKDEQTQAEILKSKITEMRGQIESKNEQINDLSKKLQEALTPCKLDNPIAKRNKKIKELELQLKSKTTEIVKLHTEPKATKEKEMQLSKQAFEDQLKVEKQKFDTWKAEILNDLQASRHNETNLKSQVDQLQTSVRLQITDSHLKAADSVTYCKVQDELKEALTKINENNGELRDLRSEYHKLKINLQTIELKYSKEVELHAFDIQALTSCKDELNRCQEQMDQLRADRDETTETLKTRQSEWKTINKQCEEDRLELEQKLQNLNCQNTTLHDLLQAQSNHGTSERTDSLNDSVGHSSILTGTLADEEVIKFSSNMFSVVTHLKREKDISVTKTETLKRENIRLLNENELQQKRLSELTQQLTADKSPEPINFVPTIPYDDLLRKVGTLNAMTDANIRLREERDTLLIDVKKMTERMAKLEEDFVHVQEKNRELSAKTEKQRQVNITLRTHVDQLKKRTLDLVERNNKNLEDIKQLQSEHENLFTSLTTEKENLRRVNEALNALKIEKTRFEQEVSVTTKQLHTTIHERKKIQDELNNLKETNIRLTQDTIEVTGTILKKEGEIKAIQDELANKDAELTDFKIKETQIRRIAKKYKDSFNELKAQSDKLKADLAANPLEKEQAKKLEGLSIQLVSCQEKIDQLRKENENLKKEDEKQRQSDHDSVVAALKIQMETKAKEWLEQDSLKQETIARLIRENETLTTQANQLHCQLQQQGSKTSTSSGIIEKTSSDPARIANVKPMATLRDTVNIRRGGGTPLARIRSISIQNSRTAAVRTTSQASNIAALQSSTAGSVTALVPPQQRAHTTCYSPTVDAMSSSPTSSNSDYTPASSSAIGGTTMGLTSAESLSVNTNGTSISSSTSSQAILQLQIVALVSPRVEVTPQNVLTPSQQVLDQDQTAVTGSGSSSSFITAMSSHQQASGSDAVTTTQASSNKRPRDTEDNSSTKVDEYSVPEKTSSQKKRTRFGQETFQDVTDSGLDVEYQVSTSSQRDQDDEHDDVSMDDATTADVDQAANGQDGGNEIAENKVPTNTNEVDIDGNSDAPNQSSASHDAKANLDEMKELSSLNGGEQQIPMISSGSDAGPSGQGFTLREVQSPTQQQQNLFIQHAYEEIGDDSIVPSTPILCIPRKADGDSEAVTSPYPIFLHASDLKFNESRASSTNRGSVATVRRAIEGMGDKRMDLNLLDELGGDQCNPMNTSAHNSGSQQIVDDLVDGSSYENKQADQKELVAGSNSQAEVSVAHMLVSDVKNERTAFDNRASTSDSQVTNDESFTIERDKDNDGNDGVSSVSFGQDGILVEESGQEAETFIVPTDDSQFRLIVPTDNTQFRLMRSGRTYRMRRISSDSRSTPIIFHRELDQQDQQHTNSQRDSHNRQPSIRSTRIGRKRISRP